jgi:predicted RNA-binding protein with PUA-like domain
MKAGDKLIIYHTGEEKSAVGTASVVAGDPEPKDPKNPRVKIEALAALPRSVTLAEMKANRLFKESPLLRQGRLSVVPLTAEQYAFLTGK